MLIKLAALLSRREKWSALTLLLFMLVGACLETIGVGAIPAFVGLLSNPRLILVRPAFGQVGIRLAGFSPERLALLGAVVLFAYFIAKNVYLATLAFFQYRFVGRAQVRLATRLFEIYLRSPYTLHLQRNSAELLRNTNTEALDVVGAVLLPLIILTMELLTVTAILLLLFSVEPLISLVAFMVLGGATLLFSRVIRRRLERFGREIQQYRGEMIQTVNEGLGGIKVTRVYNRERFFVERYRTQAIGFARGNQFRQTTLDAPRLFLELAAIAGLLTVAGMLLTQRQATKVIPTLSLLAVAVVRMIPSFNRITSSLTTMRYGRFALDAVFDDFQSGASLPAEPSGNPTAARGLQHSIALENVHFTYPAAAAPAIRGLTLTIARGSAVAFVGATGSGKTTIADLLLGLLTPNTGRVLIDGIDLNGREMSWQRNVGYVPQEVYLSDDTIERNIAFGIAADEIDQTAVARAIEAAQLTEFIASLPAGVSTMVGERGIRLSGGQRQRIGIARALYGDPELLIMDEATSALDHETERYVMRAVEYLKVTRTIIMIAHRISTVRACDQVFLIKNGQIQQSGTYDELLQHNSAFRRLAAVE